jgi:hypothetical protein
VSIYVRNTIIDASFEPIRYLATLIKAKDLINLLRGSEFSDHNNFQTFVSMCNEFTDSRI